MTNICHVLGCLFKKRNALHVTCHLFPGQSKLLHYFCIKWREMLCGLIAYEQYKPYAPCSHSDTTSCPNEAADQVLCSSLVTSVQTLILICHIEVDIRINLPGTDDSSWSLHVLCVAARVFSRFSSFLLQSKDMHVQSSLYIHFMTVKISYQQLCIRLEKFMVS